MRIMSAGEACTMLHSDRAPFLLSAQSIQRVGWPGCVCVIFASAINTTVVSWWGEVDGIAK